MTLHQPELTKQQIAYKAVRQRIFNLPAWKPPAPASPKNVVLFEPRVQKPAWKEEETHFDAHVKQYQRRLVEMATNPAKVHIKDRCLELGISYREVVGGCRKKNIANPRHLLMWEIYQKFGLSYPAIGRLFGGRDHTSCLFAVRKIEARRAAGAI